MQIRAFLLSALTCLVGISAAGQEVFDSTFVIDRAMVLFDVDKHELTGGADTTLAAIAAKCLTTTRRYVEIEAHTDSDGSDGYNQALSERRAETVRSFLSGKGVPDDQMHIIPFGERRPVANNQTDEGKQLNRRATVELWQRTQMTLLKGQVVDLKTKEGIQASVSIRTKILKDSIQTDSSGYFNTPVPDRMPVEVTAFAPGYFFETQVLTTNSLKPVPVEITLPPAQEGEVLTLKNFYFVGNQDTLLPKSEPELPKLLKFMHFNSGIRIEIAGHINYPNKPPVSKDSWNYNLSQRRAKRVYSYLVENGIDPDRMTWNGYGNYEMVFPHAVSEREQALNRRVEIRVLENPVLKKKEQ